MKVNDRVRLVQSPDESLVPHGTEGTIRAEYERDVYGVEFDGVGSAGLISVADDGLWPCGDQADLDRTKTEIEDSDRDFGELFGETAEEVNADIAEDEAELTHWALIELVEDKVAA